MKANHLFIVLVLLAAMLLAGCSPEVRVGTLRSESQSVELGDKQSVRVDINFGAGDLELTGGAEKLLEADFTYNVDKLKPQVEYRGNKLVVRQPATRGLPALGNITDFRNEWDLRLYDEMPMDLRVDVGGGTSDLQLAGLSLTRLDVNLGAGTSTIDLSGDWERDLVVTIDTGAAGTTVLLPRDVGVRVVVDSGASIVDTSGLTKNGNVYTNAAYGSSDVIVQIKMAAGIGWINLDVAEEAAATLD